jgi:hypothetical protein
MEILSFLFELIFLTLGVYFYLLLSGRLKLTGTAEQNLALFKQNAGLLKPLSLVLACLAAISLGLHLMQFLKK